MSGTFTGIPMRHRVETEADTSESGCGVKGRPPDSDSESGPSDKRTGADRHEPSDSDLKKVKVSGEDCVDRNPHMKPEDPEKQQLVCTEVQAGPSNWEEFTPEVSAESGLTSYRTWTGMVQNSGRVVMKFMCPHSGAFHCTWTGLVFVVTWEAGLMYRTVQWDEPLLQSAGRMPAGPLFSIESPENAVCQLHLPHCETNPDQRSKSLLSVVHITDDGMKFIEPLEITDTHVVIDVPHLSLFGLVWVLERIQDIISVGGQMVESISQYIRSVSGQVLLFLKPPNPETQRKKLDVLLLPFNVSINQVQQQRHNTLYIDVTSKCELITEHKYRVDCPEASLIQPEEEKFDLNFGPNYHPMFEIRLPTNTKEVTLTIRDQGNTKVWERQVDLTDHAVSEDRQPRSQQDISLEDKLFSVRPEFSGRVSGAVLNQLLDRLLQRRFINDEESEEAKMKGRSDRARYVIDLVRHKGPGACSCLIENICELDPHLSQTLNLSHPDRL